MRRTITMLAAAAALAVAATTAAAMEFSPWAPAMSAERIPGTSPNLNTRALEGCPFVAQRDDVLYFVSNREGGYGKFDIWYAERNAAGGWGEPKNFTAVNTENDEACPAAHRNGKDFLFVSDRAGGCGGWDIYSTRLHATRGWSTPRNLGCIVNSAADDASPSLVENELYFSSMRPGGFSAEAPDRTSGDSDIYVSAFDGSSFGPPTLVPGLNTAVHDARPNVRRDGLEIFFDSNRVGGWGLLDLWTSTRASTSEPWATPTNLGGDVNSIANDLRASLSWDGRTLYFGSARLGGEGSQDLYVTTRER